jgi:predicted RNase H-like HicB family nuclease
MKAKRNNIMKTLKIVIERSADMFGAYAENAKGIYGEGDTVGEAKQSILDAIDIIKEEFTPENIPAILKGDYEIIYHFDVESLLNYYKGIFTNSALEKITGINQRQLQHYSSGLKRPRQPQLKKIEEGLHRLAAELQAVELM